MVWNSISWAQNVTKVVVISFLLIDKGIVLSVCISLHRKFSFIYFLLFTVVYRSERTFDLLHVELIFVHWPSHFPWRWVRFLQYSILVCLFNISCCAFRCFILFRVCSSFGVLSFLLFTSTVISTYSLRSGNFLRFCFILSKLFECTLVSWLNIWTSLCLNNSLWGLLVELRRNYSGWSEFCSKRLWLFSSLICPSWVISFHAVTNFGILSLNRKLILFLFWFIGYRRAVCLHTIWFFFIY